MYANNLGIETDCDYGIPVAVPVTDGPGIDLPEEFISVADYKAYLNVE